MTNTEDNFTTTPDAAAAYEAHRADADGPEERIEAAASALMDAIVSGAVATGQAAYDDAGVLLWAVATEAPNPSWTAAPDAAEWARIGRDSPDDLDTYCGDCGAYLDADDIPESWRICGACGLIQDCRHCHISECGGC